MTDALLQPASDAAALPPDLARRMRLEQFRLLFLQYRRVTLPALFVTAGVAYVVWGQAPAGWVIAWVAVNLTMPVIRWWICREYLATTEQIERYFSRASWLAYSAFLPGIWTGLAAPLFLPWLPVEEQALLTMIIACTVSASLASSAPFPPTFYGYGSMMLLLLAGSWMSSPSEVGWVIALLVLVLLVILVNFVRDNGNMVRESIRIRFEREPLLQEQRRLINLLQDASDRAELARRQAEEASRAKSRFLASASHDLRQPLHAISLLSAVLSEVSRDRTTSEIAGQLQRSVDSLDRLFSALLDLSKLDAGVLVPARASVEPAQLFAPLLAEYAQRAQVQGLAWHSRVAPGAMMLDAVLVERILRNLLDNAIKYTPHGKVSLDFRHEAGEAVIVVSDTGAGIPDEEHERVFEEFYQIQNPERDRRNGLGLGLAIVSRLVTLLGGRISLTSAPALGSTFEVVLPAAAASSGQEVKAVQDTEAIDLHGLPVLVIDDDIEVRDAMSLILRHWNCDAYIARDEAEALAMIEGMTAGVIISDYRLAHGVLGTDVLRHLLAAAPGATGLLITGDIAAAELQTIRESGFPLLHKPVHYRELKGLLRAAGSRANGQS